VLFLLTQYSHQPWNTTPLLSRKTMWLCTGEAVKLPCFLLPLISLLALVEWNKYNLRLGSSIIWNLGLGHPVGERCLHRAFSLSCLPSAQVEPVLAPPPTSVAWIQVQAATRIWFTRFRPFFLWIYFCFVRLVCIYEHCNSYLDT
jgi:hypothetical protein